MGLTTKNPKKYRNLSFVMVAREPHGRRRYLPRLYMDEFDFTESEVWLNEALTVSPQGADAIEGTTHLLWGYLWFQRGRPDLAKQEYEAAARVFLEHR